MSILTDQILRWGLTRNTCIWLVTGIILNSSPTSILAADWPRFLGPSADNTSRETGLLERWPDAGPSVLWEKAVGTGYSAPSILGDLLVLHHRKGDAEVVEAMEATSGKLVWSHEYLSRFQDPYGYNSGPRATPVLAVGRCFTFGAEGMLKCLDLETGQEVWSVATRERWNIPDAFFGVGSSPLWVGNRLLVMVGGQPNSGLVAFEPSTGKVLWESVGQANWEGVMTTRWRREAPYTWTGHEKLASYATPVAAHIAGKTHVLCLMRQGLVSLDADSGRIRFSQWFQSPVNESVNAMCPVVQGNQILISSAYYRLGAVLYEVQQDGNSVSEIWRDPVRARQRDPVTKRLLDPVLEIHWNTPVLHEGHLYAFSGRNEPDASFRCVEFDSGKLKWSRNEGWRRSGQRPQPEVYGRGSAILAEERLIVLGEGGRLGLFRPNPEQAEEICSWQLPSLHYPCWTAPVLANRRLYLRGENQLICLDWRRP